MWFLFSSHLGLAAPTCLNLMKSSRICQLSIIIFTRQTKRLPHFMCLEIQHLPSLPLLVCLVICLIDFWLEFIMIHGLWLCCYVTILFGKVVSCLRWFAWLIVELSAWFHHDSWLWPWEWPWYSVAMLFIRWWHVLNLFSDWLLSYL